MSHFDIDMLAFFSLLLFMSTFVWMFLKEAIGAIILAMILLFVIWGEDICSRPQRVAFYTQHFERGGQLICRDDAYHPLLISMTRGWESQGGYFFKGDHGINPLDDKCEVQGMSEPRCISPTIQILLVVSAVLGIFGWIEWILISQRSNEAKIKQRKEDEENTLKATQEIADLYNSDPELKEWTEFIGDTIEHSEEDVNKARADQQVSSAAIHKKDREIRDREHEDDDDTSR